MGIFNWLGKVFPKKEQIEILVPFNDLEDWVDDNTEKIVSDNKVKVNEKFNEVLENKDELNQLLVNLKNAKLHNPNIEPRMLQFMSGNRDNYINQINFFVSNFPTMDDDFFAKFQDALNDLSKRTTRSYQILQEFFSDETRRIALKLREIDELSKSVHGLKTSGQMQKISEIKEKIKEIDNSKSTNEDVIERLDIVETKLNENKMRQEFLQDKIDEKKKSEEYDKYTKLIEKRETLSSELKLLDAEVNQLFSPLKRALKKFRRITLQNEYESLIDNYLESPLVGLIDDRDFNILKLFEDIQRKISSLNLDEKENTKIKTQMDNITKEVLEVNSKKYDELKQQLLFIKDEINNNTVLSDLERLGKELNILNDEIKRGETELQELTTKRDSFDVDNKIQVLQTLVNNSLGTNICIKS